jgi:hypothetical protein
LILLFEPFCICRNCKTISSKSIMKL